jgi:hypothetical protein
VQEPATTRDDRFQELGGRQFAVQGLTVFLAAYHQL